MAYNLKLFSIFTLNCQILIFKLKLLLKININKRIFNYD